MDDKGTNLNWAGQPFRLGFGFGYGGREENILLPRERSTVITETDLAAIFESGALTRAEAAKLLEANTGASRATCYRALDRFAKRLKDENGMLSWRH